MMCILVILKREMYREMADFTFTGFDNVAQGNNKDVLDNILATFRKYKTFPKVTYTNPVSTMQMNASISQVKRPVHDNVYFIFDHKGSCQYIGVKENMTGINNRLKLHMIENDSAGTKRVYNILWAFKKQRNSGRENKKRNPLCIMEFAYTTNTGEFPMPDFTTKWMS